MRHVKVTKTENYKDSQGEHKVVKGKLLLIYNDKFLPHSGMIGSNKVHPLFIWTQTHQNNFKDLVEYHSTEVVLHYIISETEPIYEGDIVYHPSAGVGEVIEMDVSFQMGHRVKFHSGEVSCCKILSKVLVSSDEFSHKHRSCIVNEKMQHGDIVYVECVENGIINLNSGGQTEWMEIKFDGYNFAKLFPVGKSDILYTEKEVEALLQLQREACAKAYSDNATSTINWVKQSLKDTKINFRKSFKELLN